MAPSAATQRATSASDFGPLLSKCDSTDADIRFMVLADMGSMLYHSPATILRSDDKYAPLIVEKVVELIDDSNGDVQSQALKTVGPLASKIGDMLLKEFIAKLVSQSTTKSLDESIYITAARTVVASLPHPTTAGVAQQDVLIAYDAIHKVVIPRLLGLQIKETNSQRPTSFPSLGLLDIEKDGSANAEGIELASQVLVSYGALLHDLDKRKILSKLFTLLDDSRPSVIAQKKAVSAIASLSVHLTETGFKAELVPGITNRLSREVVPDRQRRMLTMLVGALASVGPRRMETDVVAKLVPLVLRPISKEQFDELTTAAQEDDADLHKEEVVEAALTTVEDLFAHCSKAMSDSRDVAIDASLRFLTYDPNLIQQDEDDDEMADEDFAADEDDDFEDDPELSDSDDSSWKIRRCAAKVLHAVIKTGGSANLLESGILYDKIAPVLIKRFNEREESVRLEVIAAVALLIQKTADATTLSFQKNRRVAGQASVSRKRRRSSTVQATPERPFANSGELSPRASPSPTSGPQGDLAKVAPKIANAAVLAYKQASLPSKQAAASLLRDLILARQGKLDAQLGQILPATIDISRSSNTASGGSHTTAGSAAATGTTLRIIGLQLLAAVCDNHSSKALQPYMADITSAVAESARDPHYKIATEAILASVSIIQALTPPRGLGTSEKTQVDLSAMTDILLERAQSSSVELEVRSSAIRAIGVLLARTAGQTTFLTASKRSEALKVLADRLKNEVTRLATIEAVDSIANAPITVTDYSPEWLQSTVLELAQQLRKADRALSSNSLSTLNNILSQDKVGEMLGESTSAALVQFLLPSVTIASPGQLTVALLCLSQLIKTVNIGAVDKALYGQLTSLAHNHISGSPYYAFLDLVETIGSSGAGAPLLQMLMQLGVGGPADVVGAAIGTLLAVNQAGLDVSYTDIAQELKTTQDDKRKSLALSILGQYGLCLGSASPLSPRDFLPYLDYPKQEVSRAAALALGRAGSANTSIFFPVILNELKRSSDRKRQSALLPAVKEILVKSSPSRSDVASQADELWTILMQVASTEDNRAVGAECVGKLITIDPAKFLPQMQAQAQASSADVRGLIIQAFRFALSDSDSSLDDHLRPIVAPILTSMLRDDDIENRRLALMTLNAAFTSKTAVVSPCLPQLITMVVERSRVDPKLVREVQMGPFKHKVDDGLDIRKGAYETLHAFIDTVYSRIDPAAMIERIIDGLGDDHDIKILCALIVSKLVYIDKPQVAKHLHEIAARFSPSVAYKMKDTAVKQEIERAQEAQKDMLKATAVLHKAFGNGSDVDQTIWLSWESYMEMVNKDYKIQLTQAEALVEAP